MLIVTEILKKFDSRFTSTAVSGSKVSVSNLFDGVTPCAFFTNEGFLIGIILNGVANKSC